ncbi:hypothetical protein ACKQTC_08420, partial [Peptococcus simiae]
SPEKVDKTALEASLAKAKKWLDANNTVKTGVTIQYEEQILPFLESAYTESKKVADDVSATEVKVKDATAKLDRAMEEFCKYYQQKMQGMSIRLEDLAAKIPEENTSEEAERYRGVLNSQKNIMLQMLKNKSLGGDDLALYYIQAQQAYKEAEAYIKSLTEAGHFEGLPRALDWPISKPLTAQDIEKQFDDLEEDTHVIKPESHTFTQTGQQTLPVTLQFSDGSTKEVDLVVMVKDKLDDYSDVRIKPVDELKALDANQNYVDGTYQGSAKGYQKIIDVQVTVAGGKITAVEKTEKGIKIDDGGEFERFGFDGVINSVIDKQDPKNLAAQLNTKLDLIQGLYNFAAPKNHTDEAYKEAMKHFFGDDSNSPKGVDQVDGNIKAYDAIGRKVLPKLLEAQYDRVTIATKGKGPDVTSSATWTARGTANAIVDALQKANAENDIVSLKVGGQRVQLNKAAAKYTAEGYIQGDPFNYSEYEVTLEKRDGSQEVIKGADFAAKGIKVLKTETQAPIQDGMLLTQDNVGHDVREGLEVTFLQESSGAKGYLKLVIARNETLHLTSFDYRIQGTDEWKPLYQLTAQDDPTDFIYSIPVKKTDLDAMVGQKIELRTHYKDKKDNTYTMEFTGDRAFTVPKNRSEKMYPSIRGMELDTQGRFVKLPQDNYRLTFVEAE